MPIEARFRPRLSLRACALCALGLALLSPACEKKPARTTPQVLVPSIEREPNQPASATAPVMPPVPGPEFGPPAPPPQHVENNKHKNHRPARRHEKPAEAGKSEQAKPGTGAQENPASASGGAGAAQITAAVPPAAAHSQTQSTEQLLHASEAKLAGLGRSLSTSEKAMVQQARSYIDQSSEAMRSGDLERAYNLAMKASLLANELAK